MTMTTQRLDEGYRDDFSARVHDVDDKTHRVAVDYPIAIDHHGTDFGPGAFEEGWRHRLPVMCVNHNEDAVIGRAVSAQSLPNAHRVVGRFSSFADVPAARAAWANIRDEIFPGFSFRFAEGRAVPHPNVRSARRYTKATMLEWGPVLQPSIPGTRVVDIRSAQGAGSAVLDVLDDVRDRLTLLRFDRIQDRAHQAELAQIRATGELPWHIRERIFDAFTRAEEREAAQLDAELELVLFARHDAHRSARRGRL
jgi:hypothetical protein